MPMQDPWTYELLRERAWNAYVASACGILPVLATGEAGAGEALEVSQEFNDAIRYAALADPVRAAHLIELRAALPSRPTVADMRPITDELARLANAETGCLEAAAYF